MRRILFNMPSQYPGVQSGVARVTFKLIAHIIENSDFDVFLRSPWERSQLPEALARSRLKVVTCKRPKFIVFDVFLQIPAVVSLCRRENIDLLVNADPFGCPLGAKRRLMIVHDLYFKTIVAETGRRAAFTTDVIYRAMLSNVSGIVAVSDSTKRDLERWYAGARGKTQTIPWASTVEAVADKTLDQEPGKPFVLVVGNATSNKNFRVVAEAMVRVSQSIPDLALVHIGVDRNGTMGKVLAEAGSPVGFANYSGISDAQLAAYYKCAVALCIPSLYEGFCLPILEAQGLGCPVICSDTSALPEIAGDAALFFRPNDPEQLATHIRNVLADKELRAGMIERGVANAEKFSWRRTARQYVELFHRVIGEPK
jgi:glycosyltransferase involved in cell wall biosynthesis